jgi:putative redox protein
LDTKVTWHGGLSFTGTANTGFKVELGASPKVGGSNDGFRPLELLAVGLAGCTGMDVISILRKKRQDVTAFEVLVHAEQADEHPRVWTSVHIKYIVTGRGVKSKAVERAMQLSAESYCPALTMIGEAVNIETGYEIIETE